MSGITSSLRIILVLLFISQVQTVPAQMNFEPGPGLIPGRIGSQAPPGRKKWSGLARKPVFIYIGGGLTRSTATCSLHPYIVHSKHVNFAPAGRLGVFYYDQRKRLWQFGLTFSQAICSVSLQSMENRECRYLKLYGLEGNRLFVAGDGALQFFAGAGAGINLGTIMTEEEILDPGGQDAAGSWNVTNTYQDSGNPYLTLCPVLGVLTASDSKLAMMLSFRYNTAISLDSQSKLVGFYMINLDVALKLNRW